MSISLPEGATIVSVDDSATATLDFPTGEQLHDHKNLHIDTKAPVGGETIMYCGRDSESQSSFNTLMIPQCQYPTDENLDGSGDTKWYVRKMLYSTGMLADWLDRDDSKAIDLGFKVLDSHPGSCTYDNTVDNNPTVAVSDRISGGYAWIGADYVSIYHQANNGQYVCLYIADKSANVRYQLLAVRGEDKTKPHLTISEVDTNSQVTVEATDLESGIAGIHYYRPNNSGRLCDHLMHYNLSATIPSGSKVTVFQNEKICVLARNNIIDSDAGTDWYALSSATGSRSRPEIELSATEASGSIISLSATYNHPTSTMTYVVYDDVAACGDPADTVITYSSGDSIPLTSSLENKYICFKAVDGTDDTLVTYIAYGPISLTRAPTITVTPASDDSSPKQTITISATSTATDLPAIPAWQHKVIDGSDTCNAAEMTSGTTTGSSVTLSSEADNDKKVCFGVTDTNSNTGYAASGVISGIDRTAPTITSISGDKIDQAYGQGETIEIVVTLSEAFTAISEPSQLTLSLNSGGTATYRGSSNPDSSGHNTQLSFNYTVAAGDNAADLNVTAFNFNGDGVTDPAGNSLDATLPVGSNLADGSDAIIDTTDPVINVSSVVNNQVSATVTETNLSTFFYQLLSLTNCDATTVGTFTIYTPGTAISLHLSESACFRAEDTAGNTAYATSTTAADTTAPTITVTPASDDSSPKTTITVSATSTATDLPAIPAWQHKVIDGSDTCNAAEMTSGTTTGSSVTLSSEADNDKKVCFGVTDTNSNTGYAASGVISGIDRTAPTITSISGDKIDQAYGQGETIEIVVTLSEAFTAISEPSQLTLSLNSGGTATYRGSSNPDSSGHNTQLSFNYTVAAGDNAADLNVTAFNFNGDGVTDPAGNSLDATLPVGSNLADGSDAIIDTTDPVINVSSVVNNQVSATVTETNLSTFFYQLLSLTNCDATTVGTFTIYTPGTAISLHLSESACFRAEDTAGNTAYATSTTAADTTAPTITVTPASDDSSPKTTITVSATSTATDLPAIPAWQHKVIDGSDTCNAAEMTSGTTTGSSVTLSSEADNDKKVCFGVTDTNSNTGYAASGVISGIDRTAPRIAVSTIFHLGGSASVSATVIETNLSSFEYQLPATATCNSNNTNSFSSYTAQSVLTLAANQTVCFKATDTAGNTAYATSTDKTPPTITVTPASDDSSPKQTITISATSTAIDLPAIPAWIHKVIDGSDTCNAAEMTSGTTTGSSVTLSAEADNDKKVCFAVTDTSNNTGYAASGVITGIDRTDPTITVTPDEDDSTAKTEITVSATGDDVAAISSNVGSGIKSSSWLHKVIAGADTCDATQMSSGTSSGSSILFDAESYNSHKVCFSVEDNVGHKVYAESGTISGIDINNIDPPPTITVTPASDDSSPKQTIKVIGSSIDADIDPTSWRHKLLTPTETCGVTQMTDATLGNSPTLNRETQNNHKVCFAVTNTSNNTGYAASGVISGIDRTNPGVRVSSVVNNQVSATVTETNLSSFEYQLLISTICDSSLTRGFNTYTPGTTLTLTLGQKACFKATDTAGNTGYATSTRAGILPTITVTPASDDSSPKQTIKVIGSSIDADIDPTSWRHKLLTPTETCGVTQMTDATLGNSPTLNRETQNNHKVCFAVTNTSNNTGYAASGVISGIDRTNPGVRVSSVVNNQVSATVTETNLSSFEYQLLISTICDSSLTRGFNTYTPGTTLTLTLGQKACFKATDTAGNTGYATSTRAGILPTITVTPASDDSSPKQTIKVIGSSIDADIDPTSWRHKLLTPTETCGVTQMTDATLGNSPTLNRETQNNHKVCFAVTNTSNNTGYAASGVISGIDRTNPGVRVSSVVNNQVSATVTETNLSSFEYQLLTSTICDSSLTSGFGTYLAETVLTIEAGQKACFKASDTAGNLAYAVSGIGAADTTAPTISVSDGSLTDSFQPAATQPSQTDQPQPESPREPSQISDLSDDEAGNNASVWTVTIVSIIAISITAAITRKPKTRR